MPEEQDHDSLVAEVVRLKNQNIELLDERDNLISGMNSLRLKNAELMESCQAGFVSIFNSIALQAHANSVSKGFWSLIESLKDHPRFSEIEAIWKLSRFALKHSELSEGVEGIRKGLKDDHIPEFSMETAELADTIIRIMDYVAAYNLPVAEAIIAKMNYNAGRPYMHGGKLG